MSRCQACGGDNPDGHRFCGHCGSRLSVEEPRHERKLISVLFCDLVGSTALGERLDHEQVALLLDRYHAICRHEIERNGGIVEKFIGDAVVGMFGVPVAHENDPERAVDTGLAILAAIEAHDLGVEVRIGIQTGEAFVRLDVDPSSGEGFATGDTLNTAARLEAAAPTMGIAVGAETHAMTHDLFEYEALPPVVAKGKALPVAAWRPRKPRARTDVGERTPFVGRERELAELDALLGDVLATRTFGFATIVADAGMGKSRLLRELARRSDASDRPVRWRTGRCRSYGEGASFGALTAIVATHAGLDELDDRASTERKLLATMARADETEQRWLLAHLAPLVGIETTTGGDREEAYAAWTRYLELIATDAPTVIVVEDLHWADDTLIDFLASLMVRRPAAPALVVATSRPEIDERRPDWFSKGSVHMIRLGPLDTSDTRALIGGALRGADTEVVDAIASRAGGSPLYAEQLGAIVRERGDAAFDPDAIPTSVHALIASRLDSLPPDVKATLARAAVVGRTFWSGALGSGGRDAAPALAVALRRELIRAIAPSSVPGTEEFTFWHALVHDVAYGQVSKGDRARMHASIAAWLRSLERPASAEMLVHHLDAALGYAPFAPDLPVAELTEWLGPALLQTGRLYRDAGLLGNAVTYLRRALDAVPDDHDELPDLLRTLGAAARDAAEIETSTDYLQRAIAIAEARGDKAMAWQAQAELFDLRWMVRLTTDEEARRSVEQEVPRLEARGDHLGLAKAFRMLTLIAWGQERFADSERTAERGAAEAVAAGDLIEAGDISAGLCLSDYWGPNPLPSGMRRANELLERYGGNMRVQAFVLMHRSEMEALTGLHDEASVSLAEASARILEAGIGRWQGHLVPVAVSNALLADDLELAETTLALDIAGARAATNPELVLAFAEIEMRRGRPDVALEALDGHPLGLEELGADWLIAESAASRLTGEIQRAHETAAAAVARTRATDNALSGPRSELNLGLVEAALGERDAGLRRVEGALAAFQRKGSVVDARRAAVHLAALRS